MLTFPNFDPVAFSVLGWPVRWYGLCYVVGIGGVLVYCRALLSFFPQLTREHLDNLISWSVLGVVLGGRLGYILFYAPGYYAAHPEMILKIWQGGMAFHGGLLGVIVCASLYGLTHKLSLRQIGDCLACGVPLALFLGRIGNFINQEHCGRPTDMPWGMVFPKVDALARHPSQLYEAVAEGILLFLLLRLALIVFHAARKPGFLCGLFLAGYGIARVGCEFFRTPDALWEVGGWILTAGQALSVPLIVGGIFLMKRAHPDVPKCP